VDVLTATATLSDEDVVQRVKAGETPLFEVLMRRYNQRIYRVARAVLKDDVEAEDVMQQAYINAFTHLDQFAERARFSSWLTRIALYEALSRRRRRHPVTAFDEMDESMTDPLTSGHADPERDAYAGELRAILEASIDMLPEPYRLVFTMRDVEGLSTAETAEGLEIGAEAVKTRLHRARAMLRRELFDRVGPSAASAYQFHASRCDRVVAEVLKAIKNPKDG